MSEVKHELCVVYPATLGYETDYRPATTEEVKKAYREICKSQGKQRYELCGEEVWLTPYAAAALKGLAKHLWRSEP